MNKNLIIFGIAVLLIAVVLSGCNTNTANPAIQSFDVTPYSIKEGESATLSWAVNDALTVSIDNGIGYVSLTGQRTVTPTTTTTYKLTAKNGNKETYATVQIIVNELSIEERFIGTWEHGSTQNGGTITFSSSGECFYQGENAEWEIKNGKLVVDFTDINMTLTFDYEFWDDYQLLTLTDVETGQIDDYKKQKS